MYICNLCTIDQTHVSLPYVVIEADNDTFYSNGNRLTDAALRVLEKNVCG